MDTDERKFKKVLIVVITCSIVIFILLVFIFCFFRILSSENENWDRIKYPPSFEYEYTEYDPQNNISSFGFVSIPEKLKEKSHFITEEDGKVSLISEFGIDKYICHGSCNCDNNRRMTDVMSRSLVFLVGAVSSLIAYEKAKEYFSEDCRKKLSSTCPGTSIIFEIDDCSKVKEIDGEVRNKDGSRLFRDYWCEGNCLPKLAFKNEKPKELVEEFNCPKLYTHGDVVIDETGMDKQAVNHLVRTQFQREILVPYCKLNSKSRYDYITKTGSSYPLEVYLCVGCHNSIINPTIKCTWSCYLDESEVDISKDYD